MYGKNIADIICRWTRQRKYYEINEFDIAKVEENVTLLLEKFIMSKGLYMRVDKIHFTKLYYRWRMQPVAKFIYGEDEFDIHALPAGRILLTKKKGVVVTES